MSYLLATILYASAEFGKVGLAGRLHLPGILAYVRTRLSNGLVEGLHAKVRMITRRAFGFHSHEALIGMIFLCCGGIQLDPPLPTASWGESPKRSPVYLCYDELQIECFHRKWRSARIRLPRLALFDDQEESCHYLHPTVMIESEPTIAMLSNV